MPPSGAAGVGLAAYGAHAFKPADGPDKQWFIDTYDRANRQHMYHSLLLAAAPFARRPHAVGALAGAGVLLFSGRCAGPGGCCCQHQQPLLAGMLLGGAPTPPC
jgi:uncharacterized membrane protein YgdD (TMEM256/DUF423 family)